MRDLVPEAGIDGADGCDIQAWLRWWGLPGRSSRPRVTSPDQPGFAALRRGRLHSLPMVENEGWLARAEFSTSRHFAGSARLRCASPWQASFSPNNRERRMARQGGVLDLASLRRISPASLRFAVAGFILSQWSRTKNGSPGRSSRPRVTSPDQPGFAALRRGRLILSQWSRTKPGAGGGNRTRMTIRSGDFKSPASTIPPLRHRGAVQLPS